MKKIAYYYGYGYFTLPKDFRALYNVNDVTRDDPRLITYIEDNGGEVDGISVASIPDNSTDYAIISEGGDDGSEMVIYVVNGKICYAD